MAAPKKNRIELIRLRRRRELVIQGIGILTNKRDALMKEFTVTIKRVHERRKILDELMNAAIRSLLAARSSETDQSLASVALASQRDISFEMPFKNVWGVKIPEIIFPNVKREPFSRGSAPGYRGIAVDESAGKFEEVINALAKSAVEEFTAFEVGGAVKRTTRRVNALEGKIKPGLEKHIGSIRTRLEEMEMEDRFRLKRYKKLRANQNNERR